jgi:hypothetical protein
MNKSILAAAAILVASTAPALAQSYVPYGGDYRQAHQLGNIQQGLSSGELTPREAGKLYRQQQRIENYQNRAISDGYLSRHEQMKLDRMQDRAAIRNYNYQQNYRTW